MLIQRFPLPYAVFDLHFHPSQPSLLAVATSTGSVALFSVLVSRNDAQIIHIWTRLIDPEVSGLFLTWAPDKFFPDPKTDGLAVTLSDGRTTILASDDYFSKQDTISEMAVFQAKHTIEVWFVALATFVTLTGAWPFMFTGDDFGSLYTCRFAIADDQLQVEAEYNDRARHHTAGVTCILPLPFPVPTSPTQQEELINSPLLLTGSYDEYLRVYCASRSGNVLAELGLGGGVWRLGLLHANSTKERIDYLVLASCMHAGCRVVRVSFLHGTWEITVLAEFTEHRSMNYASDVWKDEAPGSSELLCMSSSFYDRRVCLWKVQVDRPS